MTDTNLFTIGQIEEATRDAWTGNSAMARLLIAALTRTQWKPQVGEVVFFQDVDESQECYVLYDGDIETFESFNILRPLTPDEVPALKVAIEALGYYVKRDSFNKESTNAEMAIEKIKELTGE